tara:strand:- start:224 stop:412 length:189 start_codon:yes stop_codon:yes gene_type:complete
MPNQYTEKSIPGTLLTSRFAVNTTPAEHLELLRATRGEPLTRWARVELLKLAREQQRKEQTK